MIGGIGSFYSIEEKVNVSAAGRQIARRGVNERYGLLAAVEASSSIPCCLLHRGNADS
jgi:hypothetical protein